MIPNETADSGETAQLDPEAITETLRELRPPGANGDGDRERFHLFDPDEGTVHVFELSVGEPIRHVDTVPVDAVDRPRPDGTGRAEKG